MPLYVDGELRDRVYNPDVEQFGFQWSNPIYNSIALAAILTNLSKDGRPIGEDLFVDSKGIRVLEVKKIRDYRNNGAPGEERMLSEMREAATEAMQEHDATRLLLEGVSKEVIDISRRGLPFTFLRIDRSSLPPEFCRRVQRQEIRSTALELANHLAAEIEQSNRLLPQYGIPSLSSPETIDEIASPIRRRGNLDYIDFM